MTKRTSCWKLCVIFLIVSAPVRAEERPPWQVVARGSLGYATDPPSAPAYRLSVASLLGFRYKPLLLGVEGAYFAGTRLEGVPVGTSGAEAAGRLYTFRLNLVGAYEWRWQKLRLAPVLGIGIEQTVLTVEGGRGESSQPVLLQGLVAAYEFNPLIAVVVDQRIQEVSFDTRWGVSYWPQVGVEISF